VQKAFGLIKELVESGGYTKKFAEGVIVTIVGRPNVGKSSLFNALLGKERAIVAKLSGTTRDAISEDVSMDGAIIKVVDTAGLRKKAEGLQQVAQQKSAEYIKESALLLHVLDASSPLKEEDLWIAERIKGKKRVIVLNKCDLPLKVREEQVRERFGPHPIVYTSCTEGVGVQTLSTLIKEQLQESWPQEFFLINERQRQLICQMREEMEEGMKYLKEETMELFAFHIKEVLSKISQFLGTDVVEGVLERIFLQFCIGK
jgi:tRNA modification GTPase